MSNMFRGISMGKLIRKAAILAVLGLSLASCQMPLQPLPLEQAVQTESKYLFPISTVLPFHDVQGCSATSFSQERQFPNIPTYIVFSGFPAYVQDPSMTSFQ